MIVHGCPTTTVEKLIIGVICGPCVFHSWMTHSCLDAMSVDFGRLPPPEEVIDCY